MKLFSKIRYTGVVSRSGYLLICIGIFLAAISFFRGIQILMFVPAFVLAIFVYALFEIQRIKKHISIRLRSEKEGIYLEIFTKKSLKYSCIAYIIKNSEVQFLEPNAHGFYDIEDIGDKTLYFYIYGSFDIFRLKKKIGIVKTKETTKDEESFILSEKYLPDEAILKLDSLKTSLYSEPYIKKSHTLKELSYKKDILEIASNTKLSKKTLAGLGKFHLLLIALASIAIVIEWNDILLNTILLVTVIGVVLFVKKRGKLSEALKNFLLIVFFILMLMMTYLTRDMSGPGSVFLVQILTLIYLFPKDFRNSFLYIFLTLFVFVAVSLFSNQIWFILVFLGYLCISIYLLFFISGTESFDSRVYTIGNTLSKKSFISAYTSILALMLIFFLILPHGNASERGTFLNNPSNEGFVSGFNKEISLENVQNIREDRRKVIVVSDVSESDVESLGLEYFRGRRYDYFNGRKWTASFPSSRYIFENTDTRNTIELNMQYYLNGSRHIYFPASPVRIEGTDIQFGNRFPDPTILQSYLGINEPISLRVSFEVDEVGKIQDTSTGSLLIRSNINENIEEVFTEYLESIPENIQNSPEALSNYVQNQSGFTYTTTDVAKNIEDFLYRSKQGHCEYYATVLTIVLQHFGYNPTFVSGFGYGEFNRFANSYIVRSSNAHTWVELYDEEQEDWIVLDPTPGQSFSARQFVGAGINRITEIYDYFDIKWYTYVVNFTGDEQRKLFKHIITSWRTIGIYILGILGIYIFLKIMIFLYHFLMLTKKEKILFLCTRNNIEISQVLEKIRNKDTKLSKKFEIFLFSSKGEILYFHEIFKIIKYSLYFDNT